MSKYNLAKASIDHNYPGAETDNQRPKVLVLLQNKNKFHWHTSWFERWTNLDLNRMELEADALLKVKDRPLHVSQGTDNFEMDDLPMMCSSESDSDSDSDKHIEVDKLLNFRTYSPNCVVLATYQNQLSIPSEIVASLFRDLQNIVLDSKDYRHEMRTIDYRPIHYSKLLPPSRTWRPEVEKVRWLARVCDIIDPSLNAYEFPTGKGQSTDQHWIPSEIEVDMHGQVKFRSEINNLDAGKYPNFQDYCGVIMTSMLPYFEVVTRQSLKSHRLQVIVKAQVYEVLPGGFYQGSFHLEGTDHEKIKAVGIYYVDIDSRLAGGNLELLRLHDGLGSNTHATTTLISIQPRQCVVFANNLVYHRMTLLENANIDGIENNHTQEVNMGRRWILNFFLVDPKEKIKSSEVIPVNLRFQKNSQYDAVWANQKRKELRDSRAAYSKTNDPRSKEYYGGAD